MKNSQCNLETFNSCYFLGENSYQQSLNFFFEFPRRQRHVERGQKCEEHYMLCKLHVTNEVIMDLLSKCTQGRDGCLVIELLMEFLSFFKF